MNFMEAAMIEAMASEQVAAKQREVSRVIDEMCRRIESLESTNTMLADTVEAQRTVIYRQKARIVYLESVVAQLRKGGAA